MRRDILGRSPTTVTGDYTHSSPEALEKAVELVADYSARRYFRSRQNHGTRAESALSAPPAETATGYAVRRFMVAGET